jgi:Uma2 family endonuclease
MSGSDPMKSPSSDVKLTYDDFVLFPDDGLRHELIDGEHYVTPSPSTRHQQVSGRLHLLIGSWLEEHPIGHLFYAPYDVVLSRFDIVEPDLVYFSNERARQVITDLHATGAPEIVVEIASPGTRKRDDTIKLRLYERVGVDEYWTVDPDRETLAIRRRDGERFAAPQTLSREAGDVLTTPVVPGLAVPLERIFRPTLSVD